VAICDNQVVQLKQLRCFIAVAEERHFGRAAQRIGMEQSPLSRTIRLLEQDLGVCLFARTTRGTRMTKAGELLLEHAHDILSSVDAARRGVQLADKRSSADDQS
jgi:DNA-binding transcriptional LysR family regulator